MSALGHKRTFAVQNGMSALPPKADINRHICACISPTDFMSTRPSALADGLMRGSSDAPIHALRLFGAASSEH
jgi:hypothetical protein